MIVPVMAISNFVLTQQIYSEETNGAHAHYREPVPLTCLRRLPPNEKVIYNIYQYSLRFAISWRLLSDLSVSP